MPSTRRRHFCLLLLPDKSKAAGGTRPADSAFDIKDQPRSTACRGIVRKDGMLLVTKIPKYDIYMFPGGRLEQGETLAECCKREVQEETGAIVEVMEESIAITEVFEDTIWTNHYFICNLSKETNLVQFTDEEIDLELEYMWLEEEKILDIYANNMGNHPHAPNIHQREFLALINSNKE
jgi:8-oxo-dGTP diphosphatase